MKLSLRLALSSNGSFRRQWFFLCALLACLGVACGDADESPEDGGSPTEEAQSDGAVVGAAPQERDATAQLSGLDAAVARDAATRFDAFAPADGSLARDAARASGDASAAKPDASAEVGPTSCAPSFKTLCSPQIVFKNDEPMGRGAIFEKVIPDPVATMQDVACTVCSILYRRPEEIPERARHKTINLTLRENPNLADASGNSIRVDLGHIANYRDEAKALLEFRGVLVHETTHLYQNYGNGGLGEGMADFVRIRVGLYERGRRSKGGAWTDPYTTSGFFFSWLAGPGVYHTDGREPHDVDIGYKINKVIGEAGPDAVPMLLMRTFGKDVETLWDDYQAAIR